jgi:hypothetical protein
MFWCLLGDAFHPMWTPLEPCAVDKIILYSYSAPAILGGDHAHAEVIVFESAAIHRVEPRLCSGLTPLRAHPECFATRPL